MTQTTIVKHISPMLAAADMAETVAFYRVVLGFSPVMETPGYSIIARQGQTIHISAHISAPATEETLASMRDHTSIYIEVSDIGAMWEQVKPFARRYKVREPFEREYGMTEFHIIDPNGCLIFVGEVTATARADQS